MASIDLFKRNDPSRGALYARLHQVQIRIEQFERNAFIFIDSVNVYSDRRSPLKTVAGGIYSKERLGQKLFDLVQTGHEVVDRNGATTVESFKDVLERLDKQIQAEREDFFSTRTVKA